MRKVDLVPAVLALAAGLLGVDGAALRASALERRSWTALYPLPPESRVTVENVQGDIRVEGWGRPEVEVTVTKTALGSASRLDDVRIAFELGDRALGIHTVYRGESGDPVKVDYHLRVPRRVRLDRLRTVQGDVTVQDVEGSVDARTLYGNIAQMNVAGRVLARAVTGSLAVSLSALPEAGASLSLDTVNGNLDLALPTEANADLELSTVAGRIEGRYIFAVSGAPGDSTRRARLGRGGVLVRLRTVRGNIRVREREDLY